MQSSEYSVLWFYPPGGDPFPVGVVLLDSASGTLLSQTLHDLVEFEANPHFKSVLPDFQEMVFDLGKGRSPAEVYTFLRESLSNVFRLDAPRSLAGQTSQKTVKELFEVLVSADSERSLLVRLDDTR